MQPSRGGRRTVAVGRNLRDYVRVINEYLECWIASGESMRRFSLWKVINPTGCVCLVALAFCNVASGSPYQKEKTHARLKIGQAVSHSMCQQDLNTCLCPKGAEGVQFLTGDRELKFVCVKANCKTIHQLRIRPTMQGSREGVCEGKS